MKTTFTKEEVVDFLNKSTTATKMISSLKGRVDHILKVKTIKEENAKRRNSNLSSDSPLVIVANAKESDFFDKDTVAKALMDFKKVRNSKSLWVIKNKKNELKFRKDFFSFVSRKPLAVASWGFEVTVSDNLIDEVIIDFDHPTNSHLFVDFAFNKATFDDVVNAVADDVLAVLAAAEN